VFGRTSPANRRFFFRHDGSPADLVDLFAGQAVFLIGNGPSFAEVDHSLLHRPGILTMTMNNGGHLFRSSLWIAQDSPHRFMPSIWHDPKMMKFTKLEHSHSPISETVSTDPRPTIVGDCPNVFFYRVSKRFRREQWATRRSADWGCTWKGKARGSTLVAAIHVLFKLGFRTLYLLGADFNMSASRNYFFAEQHIRQVVDENNELYVALRELFVELGPVFREHGLMIYNCTEGSHLDVFPHLGLAEAVSRHAISLDATTEGMYRRDA